MHIFLSGLILFLAGIEGSKRSLIKISSKKIAMYTQSLNENIWIWLISGIVFTAVMQSSSAVTVILISLIEAGIIGLRPAMAMVLGANIGTTFTIQLISLPVIDLYPYLLIIGLFLILLGIFVNRIIILGGITVLSFGLIFAGLNMMTVYFQQPGTKTLITKILSFSGENILSGIFVGLVVTALIQSSSAVTGITVSLARSSLISLPAAVAISLGSNVGTCVTAFLASINCKHNAKALARGHLFFNLIGVVVIMPFFNIFISFISFAGGGLPGQIANAHTFFNIINVLIFIPVFDTFISFIRRE